MRDGEYLEDVECDCCGREFDTYVEFELSGTAEGIEYLTCDCCGKEHKKRLLNKRGQTYPFPSGKINKLCDRCYIKETANEFLIKRDTNTLFSTLDEIIDSSETNHDV